MIVNVGIYMIFYAAAIILRMSQGMKNVHSEFLYVPILPDIMFSVHFRVPRFFANVKFFVMIFFYEFPGTPDFFGCVASSGYPVYTGCA